MSKNNNKIQPTNFNDTDIPNEHWNNESVQKWCKFIGIPEKDIIIIKNNELDGNWLIFKHQSGNLEKELKDLGVSPSSSVRILTNFNCKQRQQVAQGMVEVFLNDTSPNPIHTFETGISFNDIFRIFKYSHKMIIIGLKKKNSTKDYIVKSPINTPGEYIVLEAPILTINVQYKPFLRSPITKSIEIYPTAKPEDVRKLILNAFEFNHRTTTEDRLLKENHSLVDMNINYLDSHQLYELSIPMV
ncbi:hypothetical protein DLAC_08954 [Tieghemostelium lacteum]|uniref:Uncharacterized protein n=1 Tax=Tieghemostelium lacteum TaxID=361077 RepID=A0A151Z8Q4_TIELA|nr:hypothetical protein DLAC_08954 [Tieghemostelium lacteum]|eukprot:KYQ90342.1 hypothetical protein DLAC_08954 [Tieghemostelium lacteum]